MNNNRNDENQEERHIIPVHLAISAMRDSGYRNTAHALAELIDNSVQANASTVEVICVEDSILVNSRRRRRVQEIGVLDDGEGMSPEVLWLALQFGNGTHLSDRSGIGRFGMGLPNSSISQGKRVDVWTWQSGPDNAMHCYLDVEQIEDGQLKYVPEPMIESVPDEWLARSDYFSTTGTLVVWSKFDEERLTWKGARATLQNTEILVGRIYRKLINMGKLKVRLHAFGSEGELSNSEVRVNDPLYLMVPSFAPAPFDNKPMFQRYGEEDQVFTINYRGDTHEVIVRASWAKQETVPDDGTDRGAKLYGKHAAKNIGVSIVRAGRELTLDSAWAIGYNPTERWWGVEVDFSADLDEIFGVTNNKQEATRFSHMVNFDWKTEAEPGEEYLDYKQRLEEEGDPKVALIDIVEYIRTTLRNIRERLKDQTKGRRTGRKRYDEISVEDRASTKFKERAQTGHEIRSDQEPFDAEAADVLVEDLVTVKDYPESTAKEIADAAIKRQRKVIFTEIASEMDAFFSVEQMPGITQVTFNRLHPAYELLVKTLDDDISESTDRELVERILNASETLKMLFAAWARQEIEDVPNREKLRRMRMDWGRMAHDFLIDKDE